MLDDNLNIKLCDFGKSVKLNEKPCYSTVGYMPKLIIDPEHSDIYSFAITLYFIITEEDPFDINFEPIEIEIPDCKYKSIIEKCIYDKNIKLEDIKKLLDKIE